MRPSTRAFLVKNRASCEVIPAGDSIVFGFNYPWRLNKYDSISFLSSRKGKGLETRINRKQFAPNVIDSDKREKADDEVTRSQNCCLCLKASPTPKGESKFLDRNSPLVFAQ